MITSDKFYFSLSDEAKKYFSDAIKNMGWKEFMDGMWNGGKSTKSIGMKDGTDFYLDWNESNNNGGEKVMDKYFIKELIVE